MASDRRPATLTDDADLGQLDLATANPGTYVAPPRPGESLLGDSTRPGDVLVAEAKRRGARKLSLRVLATNPGAVGLSEASGYRVEGGLRGEFPD